MTNHDPRYTTDEEYCGYSYPMHIVRFCSERIGAARTEEAAQRIVNDHSEVMDLVLTGRLTAREGLLWIDGEIVDVPKADNLARALGETCAERLVAAMQQAGRLSVVHVGNEVPERRERRMFLDYVNNWTTVSGFASHWGIEEADAIALIERERKHPDNKPKGT